VKGADCSACRTRKLQFADARRWKRRAAFGVSLVSGGLVLLAEKSM
jgi:hypothetical protein